MTLTKNKIIRAIGRRTRLKNREVQAMLEALIEVWTEELVKGGRIELENFFVLKTERIDRGENAGVLLVSSSALKPPRFIWRVTLHTSKHLKLLLKKK